MGSVNNGVRVYCHKGSVLRPVKLRGSVSIGLGSAIDYGELQFSYMAFTACWASCGPSCYFLLPFVPNERCPEVGTRGSPRQRRHNDYENELCLIISFIPSLSGMAEAQTHW